MYQVGNCVTVCDCVTVCVCVCDYVCVWLCVCMFVCEYAQCVCHVQMCGLCLHLWLLVYVIAGKPDLTNPHHGQHHVHLQMGVRVNAQTHSKLWCYLTGHEDNGEWDQTHTCDCLPTTGYTAGVPTMHSYSQRVAIFTTYLTDITVVYVALAFLSRYWMKSFRRYRIARKFHRVKFSRKLVWLSFRDLFSQIPIQLSLSMT